MMPRERVLPETDGPFAIVNRRSLEPVDVTAVYSDLARLWGIEKDEVVAQVKQSFRDLMGSHLENGG